MTICGRRGKPAPESEEGVSYYAIKVVLKNGQSEFLQNGATKVPDCFPSYAAAYRQSTAMQRQRLDTEGEFLSVNIVKYPKPRKVRRA